VTELHSATELQSQRDGFTEIVTELQTQRDGITKKRDGITQREGFRESVTELHKT